MTFSHFPARGFPLFGKVFTTGSGFRLAILLFRVAGFRMNRFISNARFSKNTAESGTRCDLHNTTSRGEIKK